MNVPRDFAISFSAPFLKTRQHSQLRLATKSSTCDNKRLTFHNVAKVAKPNTLSSFTVFSYTVLSYTLVSLTLHVLITSFQQQCLFQSSSPSYTMPKSDVMKQSTPGRSSPATVIETLCHKHLTVRGPFRVQYSRTLSSTYFPFSPFRLPSDPIAHSSATSETTLHHASPQHQIASLYCRS